MFYSQGVFSRLLKFYVVCYMILVKESIKQITLPDLLSTLVLDCSEEKKEKKKKREKKKKLI